MINFYKYEGAGNDFIMINNLDGGIKLEPDYISGMCDRHFGVGADGIILLEKRDNADPSRNNEAEVDCFMNYYNSDGTLAEMCGNGVRCTADFFLNQTGLDKKELNIDTRAGVKKIVVNNDKTYSVNMGLPNFSHADFPSDNLILENFEFNFVSMGNPHAVTFVQDINNLDVKIIGPKIENDSHFPNKINVEFVEKISPARSATDVAGGPARSATDVAGGDDYYKVRVWERGCGETMACGTGACAVYSILSKNYIGPSYVKEITLEFRGGKLYLSKNHEGEIILRGPATFVFKGQIK